MELNEQQKAWSVAGQKAAEALEALRLLKTSDSAPHEEAMLMHIVEKAAVQIRLWATPETARAHWSDKLLR